VRLKKGLRIELNIEAGLPQYFVGDPHRLRQVLLNLVGNSVKFTESGVITIVIDKAEGVDSVHFAIHDTGIGMTAEQTARVFESFSQADTTTSRRFGGTGLGTTISKQLVELMGGRIWVESTLGVGSTFHFTVHLPETTFQESCLYQTQAEHNVEYFSPRSFKYYWRKTLKPMPHWLFYALNSKVITSLGSKTVRKQWTHLLKIITTSF